MGSICILTNTYPYPPGEQFLETEIEYWSKMCDGTVTLIPKRAVGRPRDVPTNVDVDLTVARTSGHIRRIDLLASAVSSPYLMTEVTWLAVNNKLSIENMRSALRSIALTLDLRNLLRSSLEKMKRPIFCYSYWFDVAAYAAALLRREGLLHRLVTRAHRFDVYEETRDNEYMPLKRQFINDFNTVFAISEDGKTYLHTRYAIPTHCLKVARLGVEVPTGANLPSNPSKWSILSVSFCVPVKRIDRIIDAVAVAAQCIPNDVLLEWTHIGDGEIRAELEKQAYSRLGYLPNVSFQFKGMVANDEVRKYLEIEDIDVFINTSESEGIPVSIMEAMSYAIPAIAPAVGGIPELVNNENGRLLSAVPSIEEIATAICDFDHFRNHKTRTLAKQKVCNCYCADRNYTEFVRMAYGTGVDGAESFL